MSVGWVQPVGSSVRRLEPPGGSNRLKKKKLENRLGDQVKQEMTEVKMSMIRKRSQDDNQKKTYERKDSVTVLGMVCEKMSE